MMTESIETVQKVVNSTTNRLIKVNSPLYKKLIRRGFVLSHGELHDILIPSSNTVYEKPIKESSNTFGHRKLDLFRKSQAKRDNYDEEEEEESVKTEIKFDDKYKCIVDLIDSEKKITNNSSSSDDESMSEIEERLNEMLSRRDTMPSGKKRVGRPSKLKLSTRLFLEDLKRDEKYSK